MKRWPSLRFTEPGKDLLVNLGWQIRDICPLEGIPHPLPLAPQLVPSLPRALWDHPAALLCVTCPIS